MAGSGLFTIDLNEENVVRDDDSSDEEIANIPADTVDVRSAIFILIITNSNLYFFFYEFTEIL